MGSLRLSGVECSGPEPQKHCSYSYHLPFCWYALTTASEPGMAVAADRNPWIASPAGDAGDFSLFNPAGTMQQQKQGNSMSDQEDGQNVLYMDSHVAFEKRSFCAINEDNVCTFWANPSPKWQQESWVGRLWLRLLCLVADENIDLGDLAQIADAWPDPGAPGLVLAS